MAQQMTRQAARQGPGAVAGAATVQDVVPIDSDDPRGAGFGTLALPLVMSSLAAAVLLFFAVPGAAARGAGLVAFAVLGGLGSTWLAQGWLSVLPGSFLLVATVMALAILAVSATVAGLATAVGRAGIGLGALTLLLLGNPLSGATSAPELLPRPWGDIGQLLPPGAGATLLRSVAYFDGAASTGPLIVLASWAVAGLVLLGVGGLRARGRRPGTPEREPVPVP